MHVFSFQVLVTDYPKLAANFAIRYFSLEQFAWTAKRLANPDFGNLPTGGSYAGAEGTTSLSIRPKASTRQPHDLQLHFDNDVVCDYSITQLLTTELSTYPLSRASPAPPSNTVSITASPSAILLVRSGWLTPSQQLCRRQQRSLCSAQGALTDVPLLCLCLCLCLGLGCLCLSIAEGLREEGPLFGMARDARSLCAEAFRAVVYRLDRSVERVPFRGIYEGSSCYYPDDTLLIGERVLAEFEGFV
ncbi:hypothetical protein CGLO_12626 [Colletotrichum gloeosporioides Cg-14]|uniref:Uncharacterized protein n=1 Tax=Colletotrichum gloeosporioides (strain Cg-14) TaxID=1237896 RepID=T0JY61_COLGC|nr:hypothetical protein CGLO_12626 [Colletotrichum gloeosporioides Cg-14]